MINHIQCTLRKKIVLININLKFVGYVYINFAFDYSILVVGVEEIRATKNLRLRVSGTTTFEPLDHQLPIESKNI